MKQLFKPHIYKIIVMILALFLLVKLIWFVISWIWLPSSGVDHVMQKGGKSLYYRVKLTPNTISAPVKQAQTTIKQEGSIDDIILLSIYNSKEATVVTVQYKGKTKVLSRDDEINGFVLKGAGNNFATFIKNEKNYKLMLLKGKNTNQGTSYTSNQAANTSVTQASPKVAGDIVDAGDRKIVDRSLIDHYANNIDDVYKNIGIADLKEGNKLKGFQISFVRRDSPFSKLGVKRGDIIKSINGQEINSYNAAFGVYKNIKDIDNLTLVIQRGSEEMELEYEIN